MRLADAGRLVRCGFARHRLALADQPRQAEADLQQGDLPRLIGRLPNPGLIATGLCEPRRGAPYTFVTNQGGPCHLQVESLRDLTDAEQLADAGLAAP